LAWYFYSRLNGYLESVRALIEHAVCSWIPTVSLKWFYGVNQPVCQISLLCRGFCFADKAGNLSDTLAMANKAKVGNTTTWWYSLLELVLDIYCKIVVSVIFWTSCGPLLNFWLALSLQTSSGLSVHDSHTFCKLLKSNVRIFTRYFIKVVLTPAWISTDWFSSDLRWLCNLFFRVC